jgi:general secretion pathway protein G
MARLLKSDGGAPEAANGRRRGEDPVKTSSKGFTLVELLIVVAIIGIIASIAIPNLLNAVDKGKQKRTMADMRSISTGVESYAVENVNYPIAATNVALRAAVEPVYMKLMPMTDGWSNAYQIDSTASAYTILSPGKDGAGNNCTAGTTSTFNDEICVVGGIFQRYPIGIQQ